MSKFWKREVLAKHILQQIAGWNLDSPAEGVGPAKAEVQFRGWMLNPAEPILLKVVCDGTVYHDGQPNVARPDVVNAKLDDEAERARLLHCGFDFTCPARDEPYYLFVTLGGEETLFARVQRTTTDVYALKGADGYLFLGGDSNDSIGQHTGVLRLPTASRQGWALNFQNIAARERQYSFRGAFLIAPSKEEILLHLHPSPRAQQTLIDDFLDAFQDQRFLFPREELRQARNFSYSRTDTHWTDVGATVAAAAVLRFWSLYDQVRTSLPTAFTVSTVIGDLGGKLLPRQQDLTLAFAEPLAHRRVFDNKVTNNGRIEVYQNRTAPIPCSCLIFGDSFGTNLALALSTVFARIVYTYKPASFDAELFALEKPDYVIFEITQRFLLGQPTVQDSVFDIAAQKVRALPPKEQAEIHASLRSYSDESLRRLAQTMLERLQLPPVVAAV